MFDKWKENWRNNKIQQHVQNNRNAYIAGGSGLAVGALGVLILTRAPMQITNNVAPVIAPVFNNDNSSAVNFAGHMTKIVQRESDLKTWPKVTEAAKEIGCSVPMLSKNLHDRSPHLYGENYRIIGIGTTG